MKRRNVWRQRTLCFLTLASLLLAGCAKEGKLDHREKVSEVYATELIEHDGAQYHYLDTYLAERWHWSDNELIRIDYSDDATYCEWFYYDARGRLSYTTVPAYGIKNCFVYEGRKLARIDCYRNDELYETLRMTHDGSKLTGIECIPAVLDTKAVLPSQASPLKMLMGNDIAVLIEASSGSKAKASGVTRYKLKWNDGNVVKMTCSEPDGTTWEARMKYDNKRNPYSEMWGHYEMSDPLFGFQMLSDNNLTELHIPFKRSQDQLIEYHYTYDGKYPTHRTTTYSYVALSELTWDEIVVKYTKEESINYE